MATTLLQSPRRPLDVLAEHGQSGRPIAVSPETPGPGRQQRHAQAAFCQPVRVSTPTLVANTASGELVIVWGLPANQIELLAQAR